MSRHLFCEFTQALYNTLSDFRAAVVLAAAWQIGHWWEEEMGEGGSLDCEEEGLDRGSEATVEFLFVSFSCNSFSGW